MKFIHEKRKAFFLKKQKKEKNKIIVPVNITNPVSEGETGSEKDLEDAVKMAKKWLEENKL